MLMYGWMMMMVELKFACRMVKMIVDKNAWKTGRVVETQKTVVHKYEKRLLYKIEALCIRKNN